MTQLFRNFRMNQSQDVSAQTVFQIRDFPIPLDFEPAGRYFLRQSRLATKDLPQELARPVSEYSANSAGPVCTASRQKGQRLKLQLVSKSKSGWLERVILASGKPTGYEENIE
jgi:hypothetical protein